MMVGAAFNDERSNYAHFTIPTHETRTAVFYSKTAFPDGPDWQTPRDTERFVVCRVKGFDYSDVIPSETIKVVETKSRELAFQQMRRGRCDILFSSGEPVLGGRLYGETSVPDDVRYQTYISEVPSDFHFMILKKSPRALDLRQQLDQTIAELIENGTRDRVFQPYYDLINE